MIVYLDGSKRASGANVSKTSNHPLLLQGIDSSTKVCKDAVSCRITATFNADDASLAVDLQQPGADGKSGGGDKDQWPKESHVFELDALAQNAEHVCRSGYGGPMCHGGTLSMLVPPMKSSGGVTVDVAECTLLDSSGAVLSSDGGSGANSEHGGQSLGGMGGLQLSSVDAPVAVASRLVPDGPALVRARSEALGLAVGSGLLVLRVPATIKIASLERAFLDDDKDAMEWNARLCEHLDTTSVDPQLTFADAIEKLGGGSSTDDARESVLLLEFEPSADKKDKKDGDDSDEVGSENGAEKSADDETGKQDAAEPASSDAGEPSSEATAPIPDESLSGIAETKETSAPTAGGEDSAAVPKKATRSQITLVVKQLQAKLKTGVEEARRRDILDTMLGPHGTPAYRWWSFIRLVQVLDSIPGFGGSFRSDQDCSALMLTILASDSVSPGGKASTDGLLLKASTPSQVAPPYEAGLPYVDSMPLFIKPGLSSPEAAKDPENLLLKPVLQSLRGMPRQNRSQLAAACVEAGVLDGILLLLSGARDIKPRHIDGLGHVQDEDALEAQRRIQWRAEEKKRIAREADDGKKRPWAKGTGYGYDGDEGGADQGID